MTELNATLTVVGLTALGIALASALIKRSPVSEPALAVLVGIAVGPYGLHWLDVARWGDVNTIVEQASRITLAIGLMGIALRLHRDSVRLLLRPVTILLTIGMLGMWLVSSALAGGVLGISLWTALLLGAIVTPTDPVVASSMVTGKFAEKHLPLRLRDGLSFESGANDGLAYLFVMLPILMLAHPPATAWSKWLVESLLIGVLGATLIGCAVGIAAAKLLKLAERFHTVANTSLLGYTIAFTLFTLGAAKLVHADAIISVFLAGVFFNLFSDKREEHQEENIQEAVAKLFTLPMFVIFGLVLPWHEWASLGWPLAALVVLVLLLRRPLVLALLGPILRRSFNRHDVMYLGWFGPIGIAAIYYAALARGHTHDPMLWHAASALIFASIMIHGVTAAPLSRLYARRAMPAPSRTESLDAPSSARSA